MHQLYKNMYKSFVFLLCMGILVGYSSLWAQVSRATVGEWTAYLGHTHGKESATMGGIVYTITNGGMISFNPKTDEVHTFSTVEGMSGINPTTIHYSSGADAIFLGYPNGMIDFFSSPDEFQYFTDIERNNFLTQKSINKFTSNDDRLYIATDFGMVIYDLKSGLPITDITQFADNPSRRAATDVCIYGDNIWVLIEDSGLYSAPKDFPNLKDPAVWVPEEGQDSLPADAIVHEIGSNSGGLYAMTNKTVYEKTDGNWHIYEILDRSWEHLYITENSVGASRISQTKIKILDGVTYNYFVTGRVTNVLVYGRNRFFNCMRFRGLLDFNDWDIRNITPSGPKTNDVVRLVAGDGEIYVAPKGYDQAFGPNYNALGVYYYTSANGWQTLDSANKSLPKEVATSFARGYYDETSSTAYMGSWGAGLVSLKNGVLQDFYTCQNSALSVINRACVPFIITDTRVSGMSLDPSGYLWVTMDLALDPLAVRSPEGEWASVPRNKLPNNHHIVDMITDDYGSKWMVNAKQGLLVYNDNGTPMDFSDDRNALPLKTGLNLGNLPTTDVTSLAKDLDGFIWVGTSQGILVYYDPYSIGQGIVVDGSTPVYERSPLLKESLINAIAVDGGNRKWIATTDGVFLVSEDGDEVIHHFTEENSPLLSNAVNDVTIDQSTGEVFFGTSFGLISYQGDATAGNTSCNDVLVFPNPVFTDNTDLISIRGSGEGSTVKITTVAGRLVTELESQGGTTTWDGKDVYGNKVRSGIYLALIADRNGNNACIGKFTVIAR